MAVKAGAVGWAMGVVGAVTLRLAAATAGMAMAAGRTLAMVSARMGIMGVIKGLVKVAVKVKLRVLRQKLRMERMNQRQTLTSILASDSNRRRVVTP
jgi:hypothetical protein